MKYFAIVTRTDKNGRQSAVFFGGSTGHGYANEANARKGFAKFQDKGNVVIAQFKDWFAAAHYTEELNHLLHS
jgi:hypothetical protein